MATAPASQIRVVDEVPETAPSIYDSAADVELQDVIPLGDRLSELTVEFLDSVLEELGKPTEISTVRLVEDGSSLDGSNDVEAPLLLALPDEALLFVGHDPTSTRWTFPAFAFVIERGAPFPTPSTAREALDLLKPGAVREAIGEREAVSRQGEWFLVSTTQVPVGKTWSPGRTGASPLGNHVPEEYGFAVDESTFVERFHEAVPDAPGSLRSVPEILEAIRRWDTAVTDGRPGYDVIQDVAGTVFVRGTVRHRQRDHFSLDAGSRWREAHTHDVDVFTADDVEGDFQVRID